MRLVVIAVGRARRAPAQAVFDQYRERSRWPMTLTEVALKGAVTETDAPAQEAALLLAALPADTGAVVALDGAGQALSSPQLAARLGQWRDGGARAAAFLIGGAYGHGRAVLDRADLCLSLGAMTWPHLLVRAMLAEQLYRAQHILAGHPYHHG